MSLDGYHTYTSLFVLLSLTMHIHRPSNCTIKLPVLEGCGPLEVAMLTAVVAIGVEVMLTALLPSSLHCIPVTQTSAGLMLGPLTAHTFTLKSWPSPPKQDTLVATRPVPPLALTLMDFRKSY